MPNLFEARPDAARREQTRSRAELGGGHLHRLHGLAAVGLRDERLGLLEALPGQVEVGLRRVHVLWLRARRHTLQSALP